MSIFGASGRSIWPTNSRIGAQNQGVRSANQYGMSPTQLTNGPLGQQMSGGVFQGAAMSPAPLSRADIARAVVTTRALLDTLSVPYIRTGSSLIADTGGRVHDVDFVVRDAGGSLADTFSGWGFHMSPAYTGVGAVVLRGGDVNIILVRGAETFRRWGTATAEAILRAPLRRDARIRIFQRHIDGA